MLRKLLLLSLPVLYIAVFSGVAAPVLAQETAQSGATCDSTVVVQADDWLSKLAEKFLGDPLAYTAIFDATNAAAVADDSYATIADPNVIEVGWKLCIPAADGDQVTDDGQMDAGDETPTATMATGLGEEMTLTLKPLTESREYQYCELVFDYGDAGSDIYSTSPLAECDLEWWDNLDLETLAAGFGANQVIKNGPQWWSMDEVRVMASEPMDVGGAPMNFGAHLPPGTMSTPKYDVFNTAKYQYLLWQAGKPTYQLVDPDGFVYVVQGHKIPVDQMASLGDQFQSLPEGWSYQVVSPTEDLIFDLTPAAPIPSVQDEFDQIYIRIPEDNSADADVSPDKTVSEQDYSTTRNLRYCELLFFHDDAGTFDVYNTTDNECPDDLWDNMDLDALAQEYGADRVTQNGPEYWMTDSLALFGSQKVTMGGIEFRFGVTIDSSAVGGSSLYVPFSPPKNQTNTYTAGSEVYELVDTDGNVYVLQARKDDVSLESLPTLGDQMTQLPEGWEYRSRVLTEDLVLVLTPDTPNPSVTDEFDQVYVQIQE
ncbi:MAG: hypothetical protein KDJ65_08680 [Anaerolineae bacterium]|nr:hypothetical protein [Anaerolineae bacterium]